MPGGPARPTRDMSPAEMLKAIDNASAIVQLRLSDDGWAREQGEKMHPNLATKDLLGFIALRASEILERLEIPNN